LQTTKLKIVRKLVQDRFALNHLVDQRTP